MDLCQGFFDEFWGNFKFLSKFLRGQDLKGVGISDLVEGSDVVRV